MTTYILHPPFVITPRLAVGLRIGGAWLSLMDTTVVDDPTYFGKRQVACMVLDLPDGTEYVDDTMQSGCGGFDGVVAIFESYLTFLESAVESYQYEQRNPGREGENTSLFPLHVVEWASSEDISSARYDLIIAGSEVDEVNEDLVQVAA